MGRRWRGRLCGCRRRLGLLVLLGLGLLGWVSLCFGMEDSDCDSDPVRWLLCCGAGEEVEVYLQALSSRTF